MIRLFDSHTHVQDARFDADREGVVERATAAGVTDLLVCGEDLASSEAAVTLAETVPGAIAAAGYHPHEARHASPEALDAIEALSRSEHVVAIGEIGLDFYRDLAPRDLQRRALDAQLAVAARLGLPVVIHSRDAEEAIEPHLRAFTEASPLRREGRALGVMHAFGGSLDQAQRYVELGFLISLACSVTYPKNDEARRIAAALPLDALLIETDSPALPPQGKRGERNEPANVIAAAEAIAEARGESIERVAEATAANAERLFTSAAVPGAAR